MNIETGEIRNADDLTPAERESGQWVPISARLARKLWGRERPQKVPTDSADYARIVKADERRKRRAAKRAADA